MDCKLYSQTTVQVECSTLNTLYSQKKMYREVHSECFKKRLSCRKLMESSVKHQASEHKVKPYSTAL